MVKLELSASLDPSPLIREKICVSLVSESTADKVAIVELAEMLEVSGIHFSSAAMGNCTDLIMLPDPTLVHRTKKTASL